MYVPTRTNTEGDQSGLYSPIRKEFRLLWNKYSDFDQNFSETLHALTPLAIINPLDLLPLNFHLSAHELETLYTAPPRNRRSIRIIKFIKNSTHQQTLKATENYGSTSWPSPFGGTATLFPIVLTISVLIWTIRYIIYNTNVHHWPSITHSTPIGSHYFLSHHFIFNSTPKNTSILHEHPYSTSFHIPKLN